VNYHTIARLGFGVASLAVRTALVSHGQANVPGSFSKASPNSEQGYGVGVGRNFKWSRSRSRGRGRSRKEFLGGAGVGKNVPTPTSV
jgi:hypothetical protein